MPATDQLLTPVFQEDDRPRREINLIVIHCSATPSGKAIGQGRPGEPGYLNAAQVINSWHAARGFRRQADARQKFNPSLPSIGYHYVIDLDGQVYTGRHLEEVGAHVADFNTRSAGICMIGGLEPAGGRYSVAQWESLWRVVLMVSQRNKVPLVSPVRPQPHLNQVGAGVCGHRDLSPDRNGDGQVSSGEWLKTCPGFDVGAWLRNGMKPDPRHMLGADHV